MAANNKSVKTSQNIIDLEQQNKNTNFTFSFRYFEPDSRYSADKEFNSNYSSIPHFLKTNSDLIQAMKTVSSETYKTTIIDKKLENVMHFKILERESSRERITEILVDVYGKSQNAIEELKEGSNFLEFGMTDGCRYIGILIDYHIIELLYLDPNHLTFADYKFDIPSKMSYTTPSIYDLKSEKYINSKTSSFDFEVDVNNEINSQYQVLKTYELEKKYEKLDMLKMIASELYDGILSKEDAIIMMLEYEEERRG